MEKKKVNTKTNLEKLKQIFDAAKVDGGSNVNWWKPNWGDNLIRVLPPINEEDVFFYEIARHRINGEWYYCLKYKKDPETGRPYNCPICEARTRFFRSGDKNLMQIAKEIRGRKQFLMNIIDRKSEDETKVYVFSAGIKIWNKMVSTMLDDDIDITDVEQGYDFLIKKEEGPKTEFGQFPSYDNSKAKRNSSPLHQDKEVAKKILQNRFVLSEIPKFDDPSVLQNAVETYLQSLTSSPADEDFYSSEKQQKSEPQQPTQQKPVKSDISAFKEKLRQQLRADEEELEEDEE